MNKILVSALIAVPMVLLGTSVAAASPAAGCRSDVCFYYDGNEQGSMWSGLADGVGDFGGDRFPQDGADGPGALVKNNAASVVNRNKLPLCVYYDENYTGRYDEIAPQSAANLVQTWNNNASYRVKHGGC